MERDLLDESPIRIKSPLYGPEMPLLVFPLWTIIVSSALGVTLKISRLFNSNLFPRALNLALIVVSFL